MHFVCGLFCLFCTIVVYLVHDCSSLLLNILVHFVYVQFSSVLFSDKLL